MYETVPIEWIQTYIHISKNLYSIPQNHLLLARLCTREWSKDRPASSVLSSCTLYKHVSFKLAVLSLCNLFKSLMIFLLTMLNSSGISLSTAPREIRRTGALVEPWALSVCGIRKYMTHSRYLDQGLYEASEDLTQSYRHCLSQIIPVIFNNCKRLHRK